MKEKQPLYEQEVSLYIAFQTLLNEGVENTIGAVSNIQFKTAPSLVY